MQLAKLFFLILAASLAVIPSRAAELRPDTTTTLITDPACVTVDQSDNGLKITVVTSNGNTKTYNWLPAPEGAPDDWDEWDSDSRSIFNVETPFKSILSGKAPRKSRKRRGGDPTTVITDGPAGLYVGATFPTDAPDQLKVSWEIGLTQLVSGKWRFSRATNLSLGLGFGFSRTAVDSKKGMLLSADQGALFFAPFPEGAHKTSSSIRNFHFTIPLMLNQRIYRRLGLSIGCELHLNTYTTAQSTYTDADGRRVKMSLKGLHQRIATPSLVAAVGLRNAVAAYVRYNPVAAFDPKFGPDFKSWALGITLGF